MKDDTISRQALLDTVDLLNWYHQNKNGEMVHGANDNEHQAWYKAEDIYKAIESVPPVKAEGHDFVEKTCLKTRLELLPFSQLAQDLPKGYTDTISRQAALDVLHGYFDGMLETDTVCPKDLYNEFEALPSAQSELEDKIRAIGYTGKEGRIYIGGRLFAVRELPQ